MEILMACRANCGKRTRRRISRRSSRIPTASQQERRKVLGSPTLTKES
jgi:hypothetical protein